MYVKGKAHRIYGWVRFSVGKRIVGERELKTQKCLYTSYGLNICMSSKFMLKFNPQEKVKLKTVVSP